MKILVTGAGGQLGHALHEVLPARHEVLWTDLEDLDVRDLAALRTFMEAERPAAVLHLAAVTHVDACETQPDRAYEVNALGARFMALAAREVGAEVLLVSTDYVFDGTARRPYEEYDEPAPLNVYGRTKLQGERALTALVDRHYIVRTSGLFGEGGNNFVATILKQQRKQATLQVVTDQICRPTYAGHLAAAIAQIIGSGNYGAYHVASAGEASWFEFARAILDRAGCGPWGVEPISSDQLARPARRPAYSVLGTRAYEYTFGHVLASWEEGLQAYLEKRGS